MFVVIVAVAAVMLSTGKGREKVKSMLTDIPAPLIGPLMVLFRTSPGETRSHIRILVYQQHFKSIFRKDGILAL